MPRLLTATFDAGVEDPACLPDGSGLPFLADREGRAGLWRITLDGATTLVADSLASDLEAHGGGQAYSQSNGGALALTRGSPTSPGDICFATTAGAPAKRLTAVNDDLLAERQVGQVTSFWATSSKDGHRFQSWIITPTGYAPGRTYPMILEIHGGPFAAYGDHFDVEKQWMATWTQWCLGFLPIGGPLLAALPWLNFRLFPPEIASSDEVPAWAARELAAMGRVTRAERTMADLVGLALVLWIFGGRWIDPTTTALLVIALLLVSRTSLTAHTTALLPVVLAAGAAVPDLPMQPFVLLLGYSLGLMGVLTPYATGPAPVYYACGYLDRRDFWRLGLVFGAIFLVALLAIGGVMVLVR